MNEHEIERISVAFNQLRPDWPVKQLATLLREPRMTNRPRRDVCVALAWIACEASTASPYRVLEAGPWWKAAGVEGTLTRRHPSPVTACKACGKELTASCCDRPTRELDLPATRTPLRELVAQAKTQTAASPAALTGNEEA